MRLKVIEIQGFKSFPDKTRLTFEQDITAVIGPNGSGKSNISDAIRWVLGEQSNKQLRGKSMEDVIFSGTQLRKPLGFAEVSITIDNSDRGLNFDNDDVTVTRRFFRSGDSEYRINGITVRLKDVHELFMDTGLGRDGYSMIGQGRIDEIVGSKSDERRDIFEEAAGISRYRYRRVEAERKLARAEDNLVRLRDILSELESRVGPLKEQSEKAQEFIVISGEKKQLEIGLWLKTLERSEELLREQDHKITLCKSQYEAVARELTELVAEAEINTIDLQKIAAQIDSIRRECSAAEEQSAHLGGEIAVLKNTLLHNAGTVERIERDIETAYADDATVDAQIEEHKNNIEELKLKSNVKAQELNELLEKLNSLSDSTGDYSKQIEEKTKSLNSIFNSISENKVLMVTADTTLSEIEAGGKDTDDNIRELEAACKESENDIDEINGILADCDSQIDQCRNILEGHELKLNKRRARLEEKKTQIDKITLDIGENERRIKILKELERNMDGFTFAVKTVSTAHERGILRGIHGPVSRLINVPSKFATAIETALGAAAQNIVVSSEEDAKRAITYLKNNNAGRATFLPLTSIKSNPLRENGIEDSIGFVGIASELVSYDSKYENIIKSLLCRTVVSEDMDSAVSTARRFGYRVRVVTLDGQVVNAGGSLTGGSNAKNAGLLNRAGKIEEHNCRIKDLQKELDKLNAEYKSLSEEAARINAEFTAASSELTAANEDKVRVLGELKLATEQHKSYKDRLALHKEQKEKAAMRVEQLKAAAAQSKVVIDGLEKQKQDIENEIELLTGSRDKLAVHRSELTEQISALRLESIAYEKDIEAEMQQIGQLEFTKENRSERISALRKEIDDINSECEAIKTKISEYEQLNNGFISRLSGSEDTIKMLTQRRSALEQESYKSRTLEREKSQDKEKLSGELARLTERKDVMQAEYDGILHKLYEEYELSRQAAEEIGIVIEDEKEATSRLNEIKRRIRSLGSVNVAAIDEYKEVSERYTYLKEQVDDIEKSKRELNKLIGELTETMKSMFIDRFTVIANHFTEVFKELFGGGTAQLKLTDPENVLESGIEIIAQPPGKSISIIEQLSGGEKALIAVSIYFAIMKVNPPPFCLLDEVEAALDEVNVDKVAQYLRRMASSTQFIVITHRRGTMEEADVLYGVTMQEKGVSKLLSIDVTEIEKTMKQKPVK